MDKLINKFSGFVQDCKSLAQKYIWPDFAPERLPLDTKEKVRQLPDTAQLDFYEQYAHRTGSLKNGRNISVFFFIFSIISGIFPISVAIVIYWWFLKENQLPEVANSALRQTLIKHKLAAHNYTERPRTPPPLQNFQNARPNFFEERTSSDFQSSFDPMKTDIEGLGVGFFLDYDLKTWEIAGEYEFSRTDGNSEKTFKLLNHSERLFLHLWKKQYTLISHVTRPVNIQMVDENLAPEIIATDAPFEMLTFEDTTFYIENFAEGMMYDLTQKSSGINAMVWNYFDGQHRKILRIERFGRADFRVFVGKYVSPFEFSDIVRNSSHF